MSFFGGEWVPWRRGAAKNSSLKQAVTTGRTSPPKSTATLVTVVGWTHWLFPPGNWQRILRYPQRCETHRSMEVSLTWKNGNMACLGKREGQSYMGRVRFVVSRKSVLRIDVLLLQLNPNRALNVVDTPIITMAMRLKNPMMNSNHFSSPNPPMLSKWMTLMERKSGRSTLAGKALKSGSDRMA